MGALYIVEFPNAKAYIGITAATAAVRFAEHEYNARTSRADYAIHRALRKYPGVAPRTLAVADDWDYLLNLERRAIAAYGTFGAGGYNMTAGGDGALGYRHSPDALKRMGAIHKGKAHHSMPHSAETKAKMSADRMGKKPLLTDEQRQKRRELMLGNTRANGLVHSEETKRKRAIAVMLAGTGVCWDSQTGKWLAFLAFGGKSKKLGRFIDKADAAAARASAVARVLEGQANA